MKIIVLVVAVVATFLMTTGTMAGSKDPVSSVKGKKQAKVQVHCKSARKAVVFYRSSTWTWQERRGGELSDRTPIVRGKSCHWAQIAAEVHQARARTAQRAYERHLVRLRDPDYAIEIVFGHYAGQAKVVAACESGDTDGDLSPHVVWASNGQYQGMFQMGSSERRLFGHGSTPHAQAVAAHRYFTASGHDWSPWSCKPW